MSAEKTIQLSPNSLNLFLECPCCFWLEKRLGIKRPPPYPYALNAAVDVLLKQEFDEYRQKNLPHPLLLENDIPALLFSNQALLNQWRNNLNGIRYYHPKIKATLFGALDDVLQFTDGKLAPLDYKSTGSQVAKVYDRFQLQMDVYTYLLEKNGFSTSRKGYLAFYVVDKTDGFKDRLPFKKELHEIETNPDDVEELFEDAVTLLRKEAPPLHNHDCKFNQWLKGATSLR